MSTRQVHLRYNPSELDRKWQQRWEESGIYKTKPDDSRPKWYELTMYPYSSGDLHIGHWYPMGPSDCHARFKRMQGYNVLHPMGFDSFGLPAENAAIQRSIHPHTWTMENIENMRRQIRSIGAIYDWDREIVCCLPEYYRWNQWLFLKLYDHGLAYRAKAPAVWCPSCQTVLANEQALNGRCERCETPITRRDLEQWFVRITTYADELLDFGGLVDWPEKIITMQRNWIGRSEGVEITFDISDYELDETLIHTFTTRIDTIFGVTYLVLAPEHPLVPSLTRPQQQNEVSMYIEEARRVTEIERLSTEKEKTGVPLGTFATNRLNGEKVPIFIADYVLMTYGTGAVMGVPAHDHRDFAFAKRYDLPIKVVVAPPDWQGEDPIAAYVEQGTLVNSEQFNGLPNLQGITGITKFIESRHWGKHTFSYRLRDWLISRQRYWGTPIPIVYCDHCGTVPVPESSLPVVLPSDADFQLTGESPLARHQGFVNTTCPNCAKSARRETDTMDTFVDSSWYMFRFIDPQYSQGPFDPQVLKKWLPVDQYTGGAEHAVMHLLYARFFTKALRDIGLLNFDEPFLRLFNQGIILGEDHEKMSKSRGNVVNPDEYVEALGADAVRCFLMFLGPWDQGGPWNTQGINGVARWLNRVWNLVLKDPSKLRNDLGPTETSDHHSAAVDGDRELQRKLHQTIRKVHQDLDSFKFNTAIAALMELINYLSKAFDEQIISCQSWKTTIETFLLMLAPLAPHISEELWERVGNTYSIHNQSFPTWDNELAKEEEITLVIQVNGKLRERIQVPIGITKEEAQRLALASPKVKAQILDKKIHQFIYVPGRLVNLVAQ